MRDNANVTRIGLSLLAVLVVATVLAGCQDTPSTEQQTRREALPAEGVARDEAAEPRAIICGTVKYEDGAPAEGLRVHCVAGPEVSLDPQGSFHFEVEPRVFWKVCLGRIALEMIYAEPGEEYRVNAVVPRGAELHGVVVTADGGRAATGCLVFLFSERWGTLGMIETRRNGHFDTDWLPHGTYDVIVQPVRHQRYRTEIVSFDSTTGRRLRIALSPAPAMPLRFENLPPEWRSGLPLVVWCFDGKSRLLTPAPTNRIGARVDGLRSLDLDEEGRPTSSMPTPEPGNYTLALLDPAHRERRWLTRDIVVTDGPLEDIVLRIPDGARVVVTPEGDTTNLDNLVIGPAAASNSDDGVYLFPRVPAGHHAIWWSGNGALVRLRDIDVPKSGEIRCTPHIPEDAAAITGWAARRGPTELRRPGDDQLVARKSPRGLWFEFAPLAPGHYVLVVGERRVPITLAPRQRLELGYADDYATR
jgi:hypothetical protein